MPKAPNANSVMVPGSGMTRPWRSVANKGLTAEFARQFAHDDPDLTELVDRWPHLDEPIRDAILSS